MNFSFLLSRGSGRSQGVGFHNSSQLHAVQVQDCSEGLSSYFFGNGEQPSRISTLTHTHQRSPLWERQLTSFHRVRYLGDLWAGRWQVLSWDGRISVREKKVVFFWTMKNGKILLSFLASLPGPLPCRCAVDGRHATYLPRYLGWSTYSLDWSTNPAWTTRRPPQN